MFSVDFETLQQIIQQQLYTGIFRAHISASRNFSESGDIELQVREGVVHCCYFINMQGKVSKMDRWNTKLISVGVLDWRLAQKPSSESLPQVSSSPSLPDVKQRLTIAQRQSSKEFPYREATLPLVQLRQWPALHRQVYSLIDGKHEALEIAQMLHKSPAEIEWIIQDLYQRGFIQLKK